MATSMSIRQCWPMLNCTKPPVTGIIISEDMFPKMVMDNEELVLRPMNCPHHMMVYKSDMRSYRDLPVRIAELGTMHRYEMSGALTGLHRVRAMTLE